ncbi:hypothetical protein ACLB2K_057523 [Fragaria x ananassa]
MFGCECWCWSSEYEELYDQFDEPKPYSLPSPLPKWPQGQSFASGRICLGEIEVVQVTEFESVWSCNRLRGKSKAVTFYRPAGIPDDFFCLGHYCQPNDQPLRGFLLAARDMVATRKDMGDGLVQDLVQKLPALINPLNYSLVWNADSTNGGCGYIWMPNPPVGYKAMGFVVTDDSEEPSLDVVRCVREDLTETCEACDQILAVDSRSSENQFQVWSTRPCERGMLCRSVSVGTFFCTNTYLDSDEELEVACLKNISSSVHAMPNLQQVHKLIEHYGPTVFFHPDEAYLPSSVQWFFKNGAVLCGDSCETGEPIDHRGSNLPSGGENLHDYWIDLPNDHDARHHIKGGDMESAKLYVHVKPAIGGTFTDVAMWIFCPFNGPATIKVGVLSFAMNKIGEHVGDWEHYTLRVSNFTGELWQVYFSEHSGGRWVDAFDLEFIEGNKSVVYSSKHGHSSYPHSGTYIQGSSKLGIGLKNEVARSKMFIDSSSKYEIVAAEYLGDGVIEEPCWLQYMRDWGPTVVYDSRSELDKIIDRLPFFVRFSVENLFELFPTELYGEEGPTGPKEKDNWLGDER